MGPRLRGDDSNHDSNKGCAYRTILAPAAFNISRSSP
jgi:hypothetical protein